MKFYCISAKSFRKEWEESYAIQTVHETKDKIWFAIAGDTEGFPVKDIPLPQRKASEIRAELDETVKALDEEKKKLESRIPEIPGLEKKIEDLYNSLNVYLAGVSGQSAAEDSLLIYQGFAPTSGGRQSPDRAQEQLVLEAVRGADEDVRSPCLQ